eukprot:COSAG02_NODE_75_length_41389_cov_106.665762_23_plen_1016_part_00
MELTGNTEVLLMFTVTGPGVAADTAPKPRVAKAAAVQVSVPKKKRKGYDHTLRVDLSEPDTEGATKYIIAVENKADLELLRQMLDGESRSSLFSPPENAQRRRVLRTLAEENANELGCDDLPLPIGTKIAVAGYGCGTYRACTGNRVFANEHTIDFCGGSKTLKLKHVYWTVCEDQMYLYVASESSTRWSWLGNHPEEWNDYSPEICDRLDAAVAEGEKTLDLMDGQRHVDLSSFPAIYQRVTAEPERRRRVRRVVWTPSSSTASALPVSTIGGCSATVVPSPVPLSSLDTTAPGVRDFIRRFGNQRLQDTSDDAQPLCTASCSSSWTKVDEEFADGLAANADALSAGLKPDTTEPEPEPEPEPETKTKTKTKTNAETNAETKTVSKTVSKTEPKLGSGSGSERSPDHAEAPAMVDEKLAKNMLPKRQPLAEMTNQQPMATNSKASTQANDKISQAVPDCTLNPLSDALPEVGEHTDDVDAKKLNMDDTTTHVPIKEKKRQASCCFHVAVVVAIVVIGIALSMVALNKFSATGTGSGVVSVGHSSALRNSSSQGYHSRQPNNIQLQCGDHDDFDEHLSSCVCITGFSGEGCEINNDDCMSTPCEHEGRCSDGVDSFKCSCTEGFTGVTCGIDIDDCASDPCQNDGFCSDGVSSFSCTCAEGYSGDACATNVDECASRPCQNNGICEDCVGTYSCTCLTGFAGEVCGTNIGDCTPNACGLQGTCIDGVSSFTCECNEHYYGSICNVRCEPDLTCSGHGECNAIGVCVCDPGRGGESCEACSSGFFLASDGACMKCPPGHFQGSSSFRGSQCNVCPPDHHDTADRSTCVRTSPMTAAGKEQEESDDGDEDDEPLSVWSLVAWQVFLACALALNGFFNEKNDPGSTSRAAEEDSGSDFGWSYCCGLAGAIHLARSGKWYLFFFTAIMEGFAYLFGCSIAMQLHRKASMEGVVSRHLFGVDTQSTEARVQKLLSLCLVIAMILLSVVIYAHLWWVIGILGWVVAVLACCCVLAMCVAAL